MKPGDSIIGALITVIGGGIFTLLGIYLNRKTDHPDDELIKELRREINELKEK